jgi:Zn finger protein HypA/HybF involved in hydrogenase expression
VIAPTFKEIRMKREEIVCPDCEAEFLIELPPTEEVRFCPFCSSDIKTDDEEDLWNGLEEDDDQ